MKRRDLMWEVRCEHHGRVTSARVVAADSWDAMVSARNQGLIEDSIDGCYSAHCLGKVNA